MRLFRRLILAGLLRSTSTTSAVSPKPNVCNGERFLSSSCYCDNTRHQTSGGAGSTAKEMLDPFALIKDEVSEITYRLRSMVVSEVPELTSAAGYFFRAGAEGKRTCPTVLLLMASALRTDTPESIIGSKNELRARHMRVAEITEMIHVASLIHDDVLDVADTRRGMDSLNSAVGNKLAVLAGDFLLFRAFSAAGSLDNTEVVSLLATALNNLVTGELMQMTITPAQRCRMDYYLQKTYYKTAALISNSCKAVAVLAGQTAEVAGLAYQYGRHLGIAYQLIDDILDFTGTSASLGKGSLSDIHQGIVTAPVLFAMEEFPELHEIVERGFDDPSDVATALEYLAKSRGIERTKLLATEHAKLAADAVDALPEVEDRVALISRQALKDLAQKLIRRTK
ncbi:solanesyl-diphosphate synthase 1, mitochondrial-like isoform X1 [Lolium rigidum]|uniref:solanesyl-diphosphate synthase 1, mitochondrial-like isoform X1 n=2 Tax=Lolium rigidum TaxID=89674 RepID=UPI001F5CD6F3|nr:solanesyl-diphosphate synthase 1, mitochondrial-like isoform X1 [Lolium rigidum]